MQRLELAIIGVPIDLGAGRRGVDMGPSAIRYAGLATQLSALGHRVRDLGNMNVPLAESFPPPADGEPMRYLDPIVAMSEVLTERIAAVVAAGQTPLVLGGDHSLTLGTVPGSTRERRLGLLWIDAHGDFNTHDTTPSGNIHGMPVSALMGLGHPALVRLTERSIRINPNNVAFVGVRDLDPGERELLRKSGIRVFTMHDIDRHSMSHVVDEALTIVTRNTDGFHLSLDLDVVDPSEAPGVGTPVFGGISYREAHLAMELIAETERLRSMDVVEVNPILDRNNTTARLAVELIASGFGKRTMER